MRFPIQPFSQAIALFRLAPLQRRFSMTSLYQKRIIPLADGLCRLSLAPYERCRSRLGSARQ